MITIGSTVRLNEKALPLPSGLNDAKWRVIGMDAADGATLVWLRIEGGIHCLTSVLSEVTDDV